MDGKWRPGVARSGKGGEERGEAGWLVYAAGQEQGGDPTSPRVRTVGRIWIMDGSDSCRRRERSTPTPGQPCAGAVCRWRCECAGGEALDRQRVHELTVEAYQGRLADRPQ